MKVLILGCQGNLGHQLEHAFSRDARHQVVPFPRARLDVTDGRRIRDVLRDIRPDWVLNAAAYNRVDACENNPSEYELAVRINGRAVGLLAAFCLQVRSGLVHYSTDYVFPGDRERGYIETDLPQPVNKYGETKRMGEIRLQSFSNTLLQWYIIRTSKLFGPTPPSPRSKKGFFDLMLEKAVSDPHLRVVDEELSCFTYTPDLAEATRKLVEARTPSGIYHMVNEGPSTWFDAARVLFQLTETEVFLEPVSSRDFPRPARRPPYSVLLNTKVERLRSWREALGEYLARRRFERTHQSP